MSPPRRKKIPVLRKAPTIQGSSALVPVVHETYKDAQQTNAQNQEFLQAESIIQTSQILQDEVYKLGIKIKQHEENINLLNSKRIELNDCIHDLEENTPKCQCSSTPKRKRNLRPLNEKETNEQILKHEKSAAGVLCQLNSRHETQASKLSMTKDVVGIVATLGKVEDENLSRLLSEYLGVETMLAIVCKTHEGVMALEKYDKEGSIDKSLGLHGLGPSIGRALDGRFRVICLENLRPYPGQFVLNDPQKKLDILKPRLPNGECPPGFLGFAVNMINVDGSNLFCVTSNGDGLRETLFYNLFSRLQVYKTRAEMLQALPCISDGALSLDGGMIMTSGVFSLGNRKDVDVRFPIPVVFDRNNDSEGRKKEIEWKMDKIVDDIKRERSLLDVAKFNFNKKRSEFLKFLAESSSVATQVQTNPRNSTR